MQLDIDYRSCVRQKLSKYARNSDSFSIEIKKASVNSTDIDMIFIFVYFSIF